MMTVVRNLTELRNGGWKVLLRAVRYPADATSGMTIGVGTMTEYLGRAELKIAGGRIDHGQPAPSAGHALLATSMDCSGPSMTSQHGKVDNGKKLPEWSINIMLMLSGPVGVAISGTRRPWLPPDQGETSTAAGCEWQTQSQGQGM
jgi:hypothetical protein